MDLQWENFEEGYIEELQGEYHRNRMKFILSLYPGFQHSVVDFGGGEGFFSRFLVDTGMAKEVVCVDPSPKLINHGKSQGGSHIQYEIGDVRYLQSIKSNSVDMLLALNVLAYMNSHENILFYQEARRILRNDGFVIVTHSNELFDMFTFNDLTKRFFAKNFLTDISSIIDTGSDEVDSYLTRENPLEYPMKVQKFGFTELKQEFFRFHSAPPKMLSSESRRIPGDTSLDRVPKDWRRMFQCSTYGSLLTPTR